MDDKRREGKLESISMINTCKSLIMRASISVNMERRIIINSSNCKDEIYIERSPTHSLRFHSDKRPAGREEAREIEI